MADDARDDLVAIMQRYYGASYPPINDLRAHRGAIGRAVAAFLDDPDPATRGAAVTTTVLLFDISALPSRTTTSVHGYGAYGPRDTAAITACEPRTACAPGAR